MKKASFVFCMGLALAISLGFLALSASAQQGGCPAGDTWIGPVPSFLVIPQIDKGNFQDQNGDGLLCLRIPQGFCANRGQGAGAPACGAWVWKDNSN